MEEDNTTHLVITRPEHIIKKFSINLPDLDYVIKKYPMRVTRYYYDLIEEPGDPIWRQCIPSVEEMNDPYGLDDPLREERDSPVPGLTHRYLDRVLMRVTNQCATYCRFCTRKREVGDMRKCISSSAILRQIEYVRQHSEVRDVILSGGDPLMLSDGQLKGILDSLRKIPHVEIIRIGTRIPCTFPERITENLCGMLKAYHPLFVNVHFNHPREVTDESARACGLLADAGIPLGSQTVLLKGVNDDADVMKSLMQKLLRIRVRPYYLFQADLVKGTYHFRTRVEKGLEVLKELIGHTSGLAVPHFVIDTPEGGGKVPLVPDYLQSIDDDKVVLRNYQDRYFEYDQPRAHIRLPTPVAASQQA